MALQTGDRDTLSGTLERGLAILEFFAATGEASSAVVADALGLSRSATYRILDALRERGYLEVNPASEKLRLGMRAAELGMSALAGVDVVRLALLSCGISSGPRRRRSFSRSWIARRWSTCTRRRGPRPSR